MVIGAVAWLAIGLWLAVLPNVLPVLTSDRSPGPGLDDFGVFYSAAKMVRTGNGDKLYDLEALARVESETYGHDKDANSALPFFNPPPLAGLLAPLTFLPVGAAGAVFLVLSAALFVAAVIILLRVASLDVPWGWLAAAMLFTYQAVQDTVLHGQLSFVLLFIFVAAFAAFASGRTRLGGAILGFLLLKPNLIVAPLVLLLWKRQKQALIGFGSVALLWIAGIVLVSGPGMLWDYPQFMRQAMTWDDGHGISIAGMFGWNALVRVRVGPGEMDLVNLWAGLLAVPTVGLMLWTWRGAWPHGRRALALPFSALIISALLINPHVYRQDMVLMVVPALLMIGAVQHTALRTIVSIALAAAWLMFLYHFYLMDTVGWNVSVLLLAGLLGLVALLTIGLGTWSRLWERVLHLWREFLHPPSQEFRTAGVFEAVDEVATPQEASLPTLSVVIPTLNEQDNIAALVERIDRALQGERYELVFVDDSSDETPGRIRALDNRYDVQLIHRDLSERSGGLTTAILRGLRAAHGSFVCSIDADLQHPPEKLREMLLEARTSGAGVVVASRYRKGGGAIGLSGRGRRLISLGSKWLSQALFYERLRHTTDPGSGFFLLRRSVIEGVELRPIGYKMLTEILVRGHWSRIAEVPYEFQPRLAGQSKAGLRQGLQYLHHTLRIFVEVPDVAHAWKFLVVGGTGVFVNLGLLWLLSDLVSAPAHLAWVVGVEASVLSNFWWNHTFTWRDRRAIGMRAVVFECLRYHVASFAGILTNFIVFSVTRWFGASTLLAGAAGIAGGTAMNFAGAAGFAFRKAVVVPADVSASG